MNETVSDALFDSHFGCTRRNIIVKLGAILFKALMLHGPLQYPKPTKISTRWMNKIDITLVLDPEMHGISSPRARVLRFPIRSMVTIFLMSNNPGSEMLAEISGAMLHCRP